MSNDAPAVDASVSAQTSEKTFTQEEVNRIVGSRAKDAAEKARREALAELESRHNQSSSATVIDEESIIRRAQERATEALRAEQAERARQQSEAQRQAEAENFTKDYFGKLTDSSVKERYEDADDVLGGFNHGAYPHLIMLANQEGNTADLMYHFANDPLKAAQFEQTARTDPIGATKALKRLASDIDQNIKAKQSTKKAQPPLSRMTPSSIGADNGPMTTNDWKKHPVCRW